MRASPFMTAFRKKELELRDIRYSKLFTELDLSSWVAPGVLPLPRMQDTPLTGFTVPFGTYSDPIRIPASEVNPPRRLLW